MHYICKNLDFYGGGIYNYLNMEPKNGGKIMKIGMTSLTLRNESISDVVKSAKEAGIEGIEWGVSDTHMKLCDKKSAEEIKKVSSEYAVEIFSLGSYCYMEEKKECDDALETAVLLGAPIIRIWAGKLPPCECDDEYRNKIISNTIYMAEKAKKHNIVLGFEYHPWTLTETADDAIALINDINKDNVGLYWQPSGNILPEENVLDRNKVMPYCVGNMHIQNYSEEIGYQNLSLIEDDLKLFFNDIKNKDYRIMIEFVKDGSVENLFDDARALRKVISN